MADIQLRLTPLEEVFLNVSRKAELEHAQVTSCMAWTHGCMDACAHSSCECACLHACLHACMCHVLMWSWRGPGGYMLCALCSCDSEEGDEGGIMPAALGCLLALAKAGRPSTAPCPCSCPNLTLAPCTQAEGRFEVLTLPDEGGVSIKVPIGAELIQSPGEPAIFSHL